MRSAAHWIGMRGLRFRELFVSLTLLVVALAVFATPVKANELWVAPAKNSADKLIADFAAVQKKAHFGFGVPDNFNGFTRATVLLIGGKDQEIRYDLTLSISRNLASDTASVTVMKDIPATVFKGQLLELDVSAIFNSAPLLEPGTDYVSLSIDLSTSRARRADEREGEDDRNENDSSDTGNLHVLLFGMRFQYVGPLGPTGPAGPKGEVGNTGPEGSAGATGPQGPAGATGPQGSTGPTGPQGLVGLTGAIGPPGPGGPKGLNARGAWSNAAGYVLDDVVTDGGQSWRCLRVNCTVGSPPTLSIQDPEWELLAAKGADGATGRQGPQGPSGPTGPAGVNGLNGAPGPAGATGPTGPSGPAGPAGPEGTAKYAAPPCFDNSNRYVDCGNGTVTDTVTGLVWLKNANCFGIASYLPSAVAGLAAAKPAVAALEDGQCGLTDGSSAGDWRLPTKAEWDATIARALVLGCGFLHLGGPSLTNDAGTGCLSAGPTSFTGVQQSSYFSSNALESNLKLVWVGDLANGGVSLGNKAETFSYVWPVRGGQ